RSSRSASRAQSAVRSFPGRTAPSYQAFETPRTFTGEELLLFQMAYQTRCRGLTGMRTHVADGIEAASLVQRPYRHLGTRERSAEQIRYPMPTAPVETFGYYLRPGHFC